MTDDYDRDEQGRIKMTFRNLEVAQQEVANQPMDNPDYYLPSFRCPNPNRLEPHYVWFSCFYRCTKYEEDYEKSTNNKEFNHFKSCRKDCDLPGCRCKCHNSSKKEVDE